MPDKHNAHPGSQTPHITSGGNSIISTPVISTTGGKNVWINQTTFSDINTHYLYNTNTHYLYNEPNWIKSTNPGHIWWSTLSLSKSRAVDHQSLLKEIDGMAGVLFMIKPYHDHKDFFAPVYVLADDPLGATYSREPSVWNSINIATSNRPVFNYDWNSYPLVPEHGDVYIYITLAQLLNLCASDLMGIHFILGMKKTTKGINPIYKFLSQNLYSLISETTLNDIQRKLEHKSLISPSEEEVMNLFYTCYNLFQLSMTTSMDFDNQEVIDLYALARGTYSIEEQMEQAEEFFQAARNNLIDHVHPDTKSARHLARKIYWNLNDPGSLSRL